jgi:hypothetical protein
MTRREWLDVVLKVLGGAIGLFAFALVARVVGDDLGRMFLYAAGLAGGVCVVLVHLAGRTG